MSPISHLNFGAFAESSCSCSWTTTHFDSGCVEARRCRTKRGGAGSRMHLKVRDLYKRVLIVGRDYPGITARRVASPPTVLVSCLAQARTPATAEVHMFRVLGPGGLEQVRRKAKEWFFQNRDLTDEVEIKRAVARGRWYVRNELTAVIAFKKYRVLRERYSPQE